MKQNQSINSTLAYLYSLQKFGMKFGLRNSRSLLRYAGNPHRKFKSIHTAGTNGKGSTSSMIAAILTAAGYKVGLYTSPHLVTFNERIRINGKMISDADIVRYTKNLKPQIHKLQATFFEATTAIALKYFADQKVDVAVIETGLGGRLDSTNVITPIVSVITSIGKDHTEQLGKTFSSIAFEKAGIIKPSVPVVLGNISGAAKKVIVERAKELYSPILYSKRITIPTEITLQLKGEHQTANAQCALAAVIMAGSHFLIGDNAIKKGFEQTAELTGLRGRFELIKTKPAILIDVAHNPAGMKTLIGELKRLPYKNIVVVFGVMKDKDYRAMSKELKKLKPLVIATQPLVERALSSLELAAALTSLKIDVRSKQTVTEAFHLGRTLAGSSGLLVVTGSHYLVGEVLEKTKI